ncbi:MAG: hypothetical protein JWN80_2204 [Microbacteriaceae bacterium]|jgi:hypothetical protein|nr:hypothetical protein [Microbacteriaceae bacterium]
MSAFFGLVLYVGIALLALFAVVEIVYAIAAVGAAINPDFGLFGLFSK